MIMIIITLLPSVFYYFLLLERLVGFYHPHYYHLDYYYYHYGYHKYYTNININIYINKMLHRYDLCFLTMNKRVFFYVVVGDATPKLNLSTNLKPTKQNQPQSRVSH